MAALSPTAKAIIMVCLAALCYTLNDTMTKLLIDRYDVTVIIFVRSLLALLLLMVMAVVIGRDRVRWSPQMPFHALRGAINLLAAYLYINGLRYLTVAEATIIVFAAPFMVTLGAIVIFQERVDWRKWAAVLVSFAGVAIAIQPGTDTFQPASLLILASAFLYAVNSLTSRWIPAGDNLWTVSFMGAACAALFIAPFTVGRWSAFHAGDVALFAGAALSSSFGVGLGTLAYRSVPASELTPYGYSGLIWSIAAAWIVWGSVPGLWTVAGALVIASSSIFHFMSRRNDG